MTVIDARGSLFSWFESNDSFCLERDCSKLILIHDGEDGEKKACVLAALSEFIDADLLSKSEYGDIEFFFLKRPFASMDQTVSLNAVVAASVSEEVNNFCQLINDERDFCDPTSIRERDVGNLINIIRFYRGDFSEDDKEKLD